MKPFVHSDGTLRVESPRLGVVNRAGFRGHVSRITTTHHMRAALRGGKYTSVGGYPIFFATTDGSALCWDCAKAEYKQISYALRHQLNGDWRVFACEVNWESTDLYCAHCNKPIESAYGDVAKTESSDV